MSPDNINKGPNQVIAQLSTANGSFSEPIEMGRITTNTSGSITVTIPSGIYTGDHYRIRLVTTNYPMISEDNGSDLSIFLNTELAEVTDEEEVLGVEVFDLSGRIVAEQEMASGIYIKKYRTTNGYTVKKFMKQ